MRLALLIALTMTAFAANSVLNRMAVDGGFAAPGQFAAVRVIAGAVVLAALVVLRGGALPLKARRRVIGAGALALYMIGFSLAYLTLDAGVGALILFGVVQMSIFAYAAATGVPATGRQITGALIAFAGLIWVLWPDDSRIGDLWGVAFMVLAGLGWAAYTLAGRGEADALAGTAANFLWAVPLVTPMPFLLGEISGLTWPGLALAILSGGVTSGLGYALWYWIVPRIAPATAAIVQLGVPVIALLGGLLLLSEPASLRLLTGSVLVLGGIALSLRPARSNAAR